MSRTSAVDTPDSFLMLDHNEVHRLVPGITQERIRREVACPCHSDAEPTSRNAREEPVIPPAAASMPSAFRVECGSWYQKHGRAFAVRGYEGVCDAERILRTCVGNLLSIRQQTLG